MWNKIETEEILIIGDKILNDFEIDLPDDDKLSLIATDINLYSYDFSSFSLAPLQQKASKNITDTIRRSVLSNVSNAKLVSKLSKKNEVEYVANLSDMAKKNIKSGEWALGIRKKTGKIYGVIKDTKTGENRGYLNLDKRTVKDLGNLPELSAIQGQLSSISEGIENLNQMIQRVELGQYNDRFSGFFSARQLIIEAISSKDDFTQKSLLLSAIQSNNNTIAKLAFSIHQDGLALVDPKTKSKDAKRIENFIQSSLGYLNSSVQLNLIAYTVLHEEDSLFATLTNYCAFLNQVLLKKNEEGHSIAWLIDNGHSGEDGNICEFTNGISNKIQTLIDNYKNIAISEGDNETSKSKKV